MLAAAVSGRVEPRAPVSSGLFRLLVPVRRRRTTCLTGLPICDRESGVTFAGVVNLADGCVASIEFPEPPKLNADPERGDFTVRYSDGYESEEPTGPGD